MNHTGRIEAVRRELEAARADALLVTDLTNVRYLTGFAGTNAQVLVSATRALLLTDPRYEARAASIVDAAEVVVYPYALRDVLPEQLLSDRIGALGIEASTMSVAERDELAGQLDGIELVATRNLIEALRRSKDPDEVAKIRAAVEIADDAFGWVLDRLVPGVTERQVALDLEMRMRLSGAEEVSFPPIVGSGPLSAHIHHTPSERALEKGDLVLLDFGARVDGYCSDLTRTVALGAPSDEEAELYVTILEAQAAAMGQLEAGVDAAYIDRCARTVIERSGHGDRFGHGLGHGVGLDIHEAPTLKKVSDDVLATGDVVTIEPGVYLPDAGGIRIEDVCLVTEDGYEVLSGAPRQELIQL